MINKMSSLMNLRTFLFDRIIRISLGIAVVLLVSCSNQNKIRKDATVVDTDSIAADAHRVSLYEAHPYWNHVAGHD